MTREIRGMGGGGGGGRVYETNFLREETGIILWHEMFADHARSSY
jgi:hypothetical protein